MSPSVPETLLETFTAAWDARDVDALMALMSDDCRFRASVGTEPGTTFSGPEEVRRGFAMFLQPPDPAAPQAETTTEPPLICDTFAVTRWTVRIPQDDGGELTVRACDVFEFDGDRIAVKDTYRKVAGAGPLG